MEDELIFSKPASFPVLQNTFHDIPFLNDAYYSTFGLKLKLGVHSGHDVKIVDPYLIEWEDGVILGESCMILSHVIEGDFLKLKKVRIKEGAIIVTAEKPRT